MKKIVITLVISVVTLTSCSVFESKASKQEVKDGYVKILKDALPSSFESDLIDELADCAIDKVYDDMSKAGANSLAEGDPDTKGPEDDVDLVDSASEDCSDQILK